jgi:uncharacterized integral membrane protein (TIGR00698 family)
MYRRALKVAPMMTDLNRTQRGNESRSPMDSGRPPNADCGFQNPIRRPFASAGRIGTLAVFVAVSAALIAYASPPTALMVGILFAFCLGNPFPKQGHRVTKRLLQGCVVLLGFGMNLPTILRTGLHGSLFAASTIGATLLVGYWVGRKLSIHPNTSALISAGTAICGGSAIAAVGSVLAVTEGQIALAMGTVFLLNAVALYLFPVLGHALGLNQHQFGMWAGVAIHDISSVVGATFGYGHEALETAIAVKLSRTLWIVPLVLGIAWAARNRKTTGECETAAGSGDGRSSRPIKVRVEFPWFIALFLLASVARSCIPAVAQCSAQISALARSGLTIVLLLIGASLSLETVRTVGWKASVQGMLLWIFISLASLVVILYEH